MRYLIVLLFFVVSCKPIDNGVDAQKVIDNSINKSNLQVIENSNLSFSFRKNNYIAKRNNGNYEFQKISKKDSVIIKDVLSNEGVKRYVNDSLIQLSEKDKKGFGDSVNSVHYFAVLPYGLNAPAARKKMLEPVIIKGKTYYKVQVTFSEEDGGTDFDDVFIYWFAKEDFKLTYLAYKYHTNGGGVRFRDVKKENLVNGIRFVDYNNYKPLDKNIDFYTIDKLYEDDKLKKISEIVLNNIEIKELN